MTDTLPIELNTPQKCIDTFKRNQEYFIEAGRALVALRDVHRAWVKINYGSFEELCQQEFGIDRRRGYQFIEAAEAYESVKKITHSAPPMNEAQARALASVPDSERAEVWEEAVATAPNGKVTAKHVKEVVNRVTGEVMDAEDLDVVEERTKPVQPRGSFDDTQAMLEGFRQITETVRGMSQLKPKASMVGAVLEAARDNVSLLNKLIVRIERNL